MSNDDEQKLRELERELDGALDEDSISEMLDGYRARKVPKPPPPPNQRDPNQRDPNQHDQSQRKKHHLERKKTLEIDSETLLAVAPSSEALDDPPTVEAYIGEAPDDRMPEAGVVMRRGRRNAGKHPSAPPPLPGDEKKRPGAASRAASHSHRAPAKPPELSNSQSAGIDLRPIDRDVEKRWELDQTPLSSVLLELVTRPGLGLLEVRTGKRRAQLVIENGRVFEVRLIPSLAKRSLTAFLQRSGQLSAARGAHFRRRAMRDGISEAQALLEEPGVISPGVVRSAVCLRTRYLVRRLLEAKLSRAQYFTLDDAASAAMIVSVPLVGIVFAQVRASHNAKSSGKRERARQRFEGMQLSRKSNLAYSINQLGLELHERQLVDRVLTKTRPFKKVLKNSPLDDGETVSVLAALDAVGLLQVEAPGLGELANSSWAEDYAETLERIELMEARLEHESAFALFGLHWTTYDAEIARAYREMSAIFKTKNLPLGLSPDERRRVRRIKKHLDAVHEKLSDSVKRKHYRKKLIDSTTRAKAAQKLEVLANAALRRRSIHSALDYFQRLLEINPSHKRAAQLLPVLIARTTRR